MDAIELRQISNTKNMVSAAVSDMFPFPSAPAQCAACYCQIVSGVLAVG